MSPDEMRKLAERATMFGSVKERRLAKVVLDLLAENERLRSENAYLRTNGTELAP